MKQRCGLKIKIRELTSKRSLRFLLIVAAIAAVSTNAASTYGANLSPTDYRIGSASDKFDDTWQIAVAFEMQAPRRLRADHLELSIGSISTSTASEAFISLGPVWRVPFRNSRAYIDFGISPTLLSGSTFGVRDIGGNFHFTSSAMIGTTLGRLDEWSLALRIQHTSNGGLRSTNPGMDVIGLSFSHVFDKP